MELNRGSAEERIKRQIYEEQVNVVDRINGFALRIVLIEATNLINGNTAVKRLQETLQ